MNALAAQELLELFRDPDHDIDRIVEFIRQDAWLTSETLKRSNRASFGGLGRTTDLFEAVSRLGYYELYGIIAASIGSRPMRPEPPAGAAEALRVTPLPLPPHRESR